MTATETTITRGDILDPANAVYGFYATSEHGVAYRVVSRVQGSVYAISDYSGLVVRVVQTGTSEASGQVRVRIEFPVDTDDAAGTLLFERSNRARGVVPVRVFA